MNLRHSVVSLCQWALLALVSLGAVACSGGSSERLSQPACNSNSRFCLVSCNLGCAVAGTCAISEIAQNQPIELHFSDLIDPASVTAGAISLKTASGESPAGEFAVAGNSLIFVPQVRITGGITRFGFRAGETYILNLRSGDTGEVLRSSSGDRLAHTVICSLTVSQGLVDLDGQPPTAELVVPAATTNVPKDSQIIVRFSELIELSSFQGGSTQTSPILYQIRKTIPDPENPSERICDPNFRPVLIQGVPAPSVLATIPPRTEIALQPAIELPNRVCVEVTVTENVRDLAGRPARRQKFTFFTEVGTPTPTTLTETFATDQRLDREVSGGTWGGGRAVPAELGGTGQLGSFDPALGSSVTGSPGTFVFSTDSHVFPADKTLFGNSIEVTDGVFDFTDFFVPAGIKVVFRGSNPAVIRVRGVCRVEGELSVDGVGPSSTYNATSQAGPPGQNGTPNPGEPATVGGAGGGAGGKGGEGCLGVGATAAMRGSPGEDCVAPGTSGYAGVVAGSGGLGGDVWPTTGNRINVTYNLFFSISGQASGGGGGGSFLGQGTQGRVNQTFTGVAADIGPGAMPGAVVPFQALPSGVSSLDHFLVGGAGGGGGGTHPVNLSSNEVNGNASNGPRPWHGGGAGGGGGGALALRVGHTLTVPQGGVLSSRGGGGAEHRSQQTGPPVPGGGGSGGSVLVQSGDVGLVSLLGSLDVSGGLGTHLNHNQFNGQFLDARGGEGGYGYVRLEADGAAAADLGNVLGPPSVTADNFGDLAPSEGDLRSGFTSLWRSTRQLFPPTFLHYRLTCRIAGQQVVFSDEPANFNPANRNDLAVRLYVQGGTVNAATNTLEGDPGPWRDFVNGEGGRSSINLDNANGFRFMIIFNRDIETDVVVEEFEVTFEA